MLYVNIYRQLQINICTNMSSSFWGGYFCVDGRHVFHGLECCEATIHLKCSAAKHCTITHYLAVNAPSKSNLYASILPVQA
jgi:hypothetical protein